jgi:hypothetical protein
LTATGADDLAGAGAPLAEEECEELLFPPATTAMTTTAAITRTMPTTIPTFAQVCWLLRASVVATARSRTKSTASSAPAASEGICLASRASERAARACASILSDSSAGTSSELSIHSSVMGGAMVPGASAGWGRGGPGTRTVAQPKARSVSRAIRRSGTVEV